MKIEQFNEALKVIPNGANIMVEWERPVKVKKAYTGLPLTKRTLMLCRIAVKYDNILEVKHGRVDGSLPAENAGLKGYEWVNYPTTLRHLKSGTLAVRLESGTFDNVKTVTQYFLNGQEVPKENYEHTMIASEKRPPKEGHLTFNVRVEYLRKLHTVTADEVEEEMAPEPIT